LPWQRPLKDHKAIYQVNKQFQHSTNAEILAKNSPLNFEILVLKSQPLKIKKKNVGKQKFGVQKWLLNPRLNYNCNLPIQKRVAKLSV